MRAFELVSTKHLKYFSRVNFSIHLVIRLSNICAGFFFSLLERFMSFMHPCPGAMLNLLCIVPTFSLHAAKANTACFLIVSYYYPKAYSLKYNRGVQLLRGVTKTVRRSGSWILYIIGLHFAQIVDKVSFVSLEGY